MEKLLRGAFAGVVLAAAQVARWGYNVVCGQSGGVGLVRERRFYSRQMRMASAPINIREHPAITLREGCSPRIMNARTTVKTTLNLSTGATFEASEILSALK